MNFVDIHTHIIPAIDDGPSTLQEVLQMLRIAHNTGTRKMVATPHMFLDPYNNNDLLKVNDCFARTLSQLKQQSESPDFAFLNEMSFYLGSENYVSPEFLEALERRRVLTLNGSRYLLIEFPAFLSPDKFLLVLRRVFESGFVPVIAHAERNLAIQERPDRLSRFTEMGCIAQINGDSILGATGSRVRKTCAVLLNKDLVHVVASDGHWAHSRPPQLQSVFLRLKQKYPLQKVHAWLAGNPSFVVRNNAFLATEAGFEDQAAGSAN